MLLKKGGKLPIFVNHDCCDCQTWIQAVLLLRNSKCYFIIVSLELYRQKCISFRQQSMPEGVH